MNKNTQKALIEYLILIAIIITGFYLVLYFKNDKPLQLISIILMMFLYFTWGILHHILEKSLHIKIVVEYSLLAITVATILIILLSIL